MSDFILKGTIFQKIIDEVKITTTFLCRSLKELLFRMIISKLIYNFWISNQLFRLFQSLKMISQAWKKWLIEVEDDAVIVEYEKDSDQFSTKFNVLLEAYCYE